MSKILQVLFVIIFASVLKGKVFAGRLEDELEEMVDHGTDSYYDAQEPEYIPPALILKKSGFWSPHPSDYNPMRRPGGTTNGQTLPPKRGNPYHPLARTVEQQQKKLEELEGFLQSNQSKRQSPGSYLLLKLGKSKSNQKASGK